MTKKSPSEASLGMSVLTVGTGPVAVANAKPAAGSSSTLILGNIAAVAAPASGVYFFVGKKKSALHRY